MNVIVALLWAVAVANAVPVEVGLVADSPVVTQTRTLTLLENGIILGDQDDVKGVADVAANDFVNNDGSLAFDGHLFALDTGGFGAIHVDPSKKTVGVDAKPVALGKEIKEIHVGN